MSTNYDKLNHSLQKLYLRAFRVHVALLGATIDHSVRIYGSFKIIGDPRNLMINRNSTINWGVIFNARARIHIGESVHISPGVQIHTGNLVRGAKDSHESKSVNIGDRVWLGSGSIILPGVSICDDVVIGAGTVLGKSIDEPGTYVSNTLRKLTN